MDNQIITDRLAILSPDYQALIKSDYAQKTAETFGPRFELDEDQTIVFENAVSMYLLLFLDRRGLIEFISTECGIERSKVVSLVDTILSGLPSQFVVEHAKQYAVFEGNTSPATPDSPPETDVSSINQTPTQETAQTPAPETPEEPIVQPLRTMEHDMDKIHGYGAYRKMYPDPEVESAIPDPATVASGASPQSTAPQQEQVTRAISQSDVLEKKSPLANTPTYTEEKIDETK